MNLNFCTHCTCYRYDPLQYGIFRLKPSRLWPGRFEDDELLANAEQTIEEESKEKTPAEEESDEDDPLDAFMAGIEVWLW